MDRAMAKTYSANYVDRLLTKLDGAITPIWITLHITVDKLPEEELLFSVFSGLVRETPRLRSLWNEIRGGWEVITSYEALLADAFCFKQDHSDMNDLVKRIIKSPINITLSLPLRLWVNRTVVNDQDCWTISFQIHHAAGDGRALFFIVQRFWDLLNHLLNQQARKYPPLDGAQMTDQMVLKKIWSNKNSLQYLTQARYRQLTTRADALNHHASIPGEPILKSCRIKLPAEKTAKLNHTEIFYSALLAAIVQSEYQSTEKNIRIRIPVDLRSLLDIRQHAVGNACSAVVLEFSLAHLKSIAQTKPEQLGVLLINELQTALKQRRYLPNALECLLASRISSAKGMKIKARQEILSSKRSSTMVVTHIGDVTRYIRPPHDINIIQVQGHTPVWGGNSLVYEHDLYMTFTCYDGIWDTEKMNSFAGFGADWLKSHYGLHGDLL
jgi:NRPS condensation-like uncharacterized protein